MRERQIWEIYTYRYANQLPLRGGSDAMLVNWVELTITHEETGVVTFGKNAFVADFEVLETTVAAIARDGRALDKSPPIPTKATEVA